MLFVHNPPESQEETIRDLRITPDDMDATYHPRHQVYRDFLRMHHEVRQDQCSSVREIAAIRGLGYSRDPQYRAIEGQYAHWIQQGIIPYSIKTILALHNTGLFPGEIGENAPSPLDQAIDQKIQPFDYKNEKMFQVSMLGNVSYWRGSFLPSSRYSGSDLRFQGSFIDEAIQRLIDDLLGHKAPRGEENNAVYVDAVFSRFMGHFGSFVGRKNRSEQLFPRHIELSLSTLHSETSSQAEKEKARRLLRDFLLAFFYAEKCKYSEGRGYSAILPSSTDPDLREKRVDAFQDIVHHARLETKMQVWKNTSSKMSRGKLEGKLYSAVCMFPDMDAFRLESLQDEFRGRVMSLTAL